MKAIILGGLSLQFTRFVSCQKSQRSVTIGSMGICGQFLAYWPIGHKLLAWPGVGVVIGGGGSRRH